MLSGDYSHRLTPIYHHNTRPHLSWSSGVAGTTVSRPHTCTVLSSRTMLPELRCLVYDCIVAGGCILLPRRLGTGNVVRTVSR